MKKILIVTPHFPPHSAPDMQRVRMSLRHYRDFGWEPVVLCVDDAWLAGAREPELMKTVPADVQIIRTPALPLHWTRWFGVRSIGLRCWLHFLFIGSKAIRRECIDLVFFSNTQFITFTLGRLWRAWHGTRYVIDVQDPWRHENYARPGARPPPGGQKYRFARLQARLLEGWTYARVSAVMSVSQHYIDDLRSRYPVLRDIPSDVIRFGASRCDIEIAKRLLPPAHNHERKPGEVHILYTGAAGPIIPHAVNVLFEGLRSYRLHAPERARLLRFHFVGTSYVASGAGSVSIMPFANACGVADQVEEIPHRIGHLESIRRQCEADVLLLPGSVDPAYSPSKVYPYILSGRPVLCLVFRRSVLEALVEELGCEHIVRFDEDGPKDDAYAALSAFFERALGGLVHNEPSQEKKASYENRLSVETLTRAQCELFDRASQPTHG